MNKKNLDRMPEIANYISLEKKMGIVHSEKEIADKFGIEPDIVQKTISIIGKIQIHKYNYTEISRIENVRLDDVMKISVSYKGQNRINSTKRQRSADSADNSEESPLERAADDNVKTYRTEKNAAVPCMLHQKHIPKYLRNNLISAIGAIALMSISANIIQSLMYNRLQKQTGKEETAQTEYIKENDTIKKIIEINKVQTDDELYKKEPAQIKPAGTDSIRYDSYADLFKKEDLMIL